MFDVLRAKLGSRFPLSAELWKEITLSAKKISLKKNEILIPYSSRRRVANIIVEGSFKQSIINSSGEQTANWFYFEDIFNVMVCLDSYALDEHTKYEIIALEDAVVYQIKKEKIDEWADEFKSFSKYYREDVIRTLFLTTEIQAQMISSTPSEFIDYLDRNYPEILVKVPSKYLAEFMGITPEWFSKLQKQKVRSQD